MLYVMLLVHMFDYDNVVWDTEFQFISVVAPMTILLAIAFSPGLWSAVGNTVAPAASGVPASTAVQAPPPTPYGQPGGHGQPPPSSAGQAPPGTYGH